MCNTDAIAISVFSFFGERPFTWSPKFPPKWITRSGNTLQMWDKDHIEAYNMYFHVLIQWTSIRFFGERPFNWSSKFSPKLVTRSWNMLRRWDKDHKLRTCTFVCNTWGTSINDFSFFWERPFTWSHKFSPTGISQSTNTLGRWDKDHIEALNMYFHVHYIGNLY